MTAPKRIYATLNGETDFRFFLTDDGETFLRWKRGAFTWHHRDELLCDHHGLNDPEVSDLIPKTQWARYQPARHG